METWNGPARESVNEWERSVEFPPGSAIGTRRVSEEIRRCGIESETGVHLDSG